MNKQKEIISYLLNQFLKQKLQNLLTDKSFEGIKWEIGTKNKLELRNV